MREKNKKMIIIITSLLLVVGVSLAYFTASVLLGGDGTSVTGSTTTIQDSTLIVEGTLEFNDLDIYPGHQSVSSIKVTATGNNELIPYNVIWKGTNTLNTPLNYTVYKTSNEIDVSASCEKKSEVMGGAKIYYEECSISNLESLGSPITEGVITTSEEETRVELIGDEFITSTQNGTSWYYYVILEYPNLEESQNIDMGGTFNGEITVEESDAEPDLNLVAVMVEKDDENYVYDYATEVPSSGYRLDQERSSCQVNGVEQEGITMEYVDGKIDFNGVSQSGTICTVYFNRILRSKKASDIILNNKNLLTRNDFSILVEGKTTNTIYYADTSLGRTYYFAGNPTDNWVSFAGFYWRIIRINEDGSVRMIYNGTKTNQTGSDTQLQTSAFNSYGDNMYAGYMYSQFQVHGLEMDSIIKGVLDRWYQNNLVNYADKISTEAGFCGDRQPSTLGGSDNGLGGVDDIYTYYGALRRLISNKVPTFECSNISDLYTVSSSSQGNHKLDYPIGLITADEVVFAGGVYNNINDDIYLDTAYNYWTMTPSSFNPSSTSSPDIFIVDVHGSPRVANVKEVLGVRPVINLRGDIELTGSGTSTDPYVVVS